MQKIREGDFLRSFWIAPGGMAVWIIVRNNEYFVQGIFSMQGWSCMHRPVDFYSIETVEETLRFLGYKEFPICELWENAPEVEKEILNEQFDMFEKTMKQIKEEMQKQQNKQEETQKPRIVRPN